MLKKIKNTGPINLQSFDDAPDGVLTIGEAGKQIPFDIKRVYYISYLNNPSAIRGKHAHRRLEQALFCVLGKFSLELYDGLSRETIQLNNPSEGVYIGPHVWHTMTQFTKDCVILVMASDYYDESDYIRDYAEFEQIVKA